jgi:glycosyltransferase involved in cell wall biosynthesis
VRILHFAETKGSANIQDNARHVAYLAAVQRARGLPVAVVTNGNGLLSSLCEQEGIPAFLAADSAGMAARLRHFGPDVIHCHDLFMTKSVVAAANRSKVPCVVTLHEVGIEQIIHEIIAARRAGLEFTIVTLFKGELDVMRRNGMPGIDFHYMANGVPVPAGPQPRKCAETGGQNLILMANLGFQEGIDVAILAMVELRRRRGSDCPVLNVYGAEFPSGFAIDEYFAEMTRVLDLCDFVKFHGIQVNVLDECSGSDVVVIPSRGEAAPLVILEAMSRGMPIVATDVGEAAELLPDRRYGRVVPVNSIIALADAIDSMLTDIAAGRFEPSLLVQRHRSRYSADLLADRVAAVYQSVTAIGLRQKF